MCKTTHIIGLAVILLGTQRSSGMDKAKRERKDKNDRTPDSIREVQTGWQGRAIKKQPKTKQAKPSYLKIFLYQDWLPSGSGERDRISL